MFSLQPPRHTSTLPLNEMAVRLGHVRSTLEANSGTNREDLATYGLAGILPDDGSIACFATWRNNGRAR